MRIKIFGLASQKFILEFSIEEMTDSESLMDFLRRNQIPIASSCLGEGVCQKCNVENKGQQILSCLIYKDKIIHDKIQQIDISYL